MHTKVTDLCGVLQLVLHKIVVFLETLLGVCEKLSSDALAIIPIRLYWGV